MIKYIEINEDYNVRSHNETCIPGICFLSCYFCGNLIEQIPYLKLVNYSDKYLCNDTCLNLYILKGEKTND